MNLLQSLVDKSLLRRAPNDRFQLLITIRDYATRELERCGDPSKTHVRHARWFARFGDLEPMIRFLSIGSHELVEPLERVRAELSDACRRLDRLPAILAARLARSAWMLFRHTGPFSEALTHLEAAMVRDLPAVEAVCTGIVLFEARRTVGTRSDPDVLGASLVGLAQQVDDPLVTAMLHDQWGRSLSRLRRFDDAYECLETALASYDVAGELPGRGGAVLVQLAHVERGRGDVVSARRRLLPAISLLETGGNRRALADAWLLAGTLTLEDPSVPHRPELLWKALQIAREERLAERELFTLISLARQSVTGGQEAMSTLRQAARELVQLGCLNGACKAYSYLGVALLGLDAIEEGRDELEVAIHYGRMQGEAGLAMALCNLAFFHLEYGDLEECRRFSNEAIVLACSLQSDEWLYARSTLALACIQLEALDEARLVIPLPEEIVTLHPPPQRTISWTAWVQLLLAEGRVDEADDVAQNLEHSPRPIATLARCRAAEARGDLDRAKLLARKLDLDAPFMRGTRSEGTARPLIAKLIGDALSIEPRSAR